MINRKNLFDDYFPPYLSVSREICCKNMYDYGIVPIVKNIINTREDIL